VKPLDKRLNAYRSDLADEALRGQVDVPRFVSGALQQVITPFANVHAKPDACSMQITQALMGEIAQVFDVADGWAWCKLTGDGYVGYINADALSDQVHTPTHRVALASTIIFPKADLKTQPVKYLTFNSMITATGQAGDYLELATGGFVYAAHCASVDAYQSDYVFAAEMFVGTPYLWGGKGIAGLDCSGLVQVALESSGRKALRDADMQEETVGTPLQINDLDGLRRGDLVFWNGHVGIMSDAATLLHANGHHMAVVKEPLGEAIERIAAKGYPVTSLKRIQ
jgi:cell wall-associated NlpC family hydrolase